MYRPTGTLTGTVTHETFRLDTNRGFPIMLLAFGDRLDSRQFVISMLQYVVRGITSRMCPCLLQYIYVEDVSERHAVRRYRRRRVSCLSVVSRLCTYRCIQYSECTVHYTVRFLSWRTVVSRTKPVAGAVCDDARNDEAGLLQLATDLHEDTTLLTIKNH
jgi:hypothetical protein